jgi:predicted transcriptional regulator
MNDVGMTSVRMPDELLEQLEEAAEKSRRSKGWIINDAVREYLAKAERKSQMLEDTREALADIRAGRVVDGSDVLDWLDSWGKDDEKTPPAL